MKILIVASNDQLSAVIKERVDTYIGCEVEMTEIETISQYIASDADVVILELFEGIEEIMQLFSTHGKLVYIIVQSSDVELLKEVLVLGGRGLVTIDNLENDIKEIAITMKNIKPVKREEKTRDIRSLRTANTRLNSFESSREIRNSFIESNTNVQRVQPIKMKKISSNIQKPATITLPNGHQIIVVYSPKGGVGKSTIATSIAAYYAKSQNPRLNVALVDFDVDFGNIQTKLRIKPSATILDWIENRQLDDLQNYMVDHSSGIKVLPAPANPADEGAVTDIVAQKVLNVLSRRFDMVVVDCGPILRDSTIIALDMATKIYMISTPDLVDLKDTYKAVQCFRDLSIDLAKTKLVINKMPKRSAIRMNEITDNIPLQVAAVLPYDEGVLIEGNRGEIPGTGRRAKQYSSSIKKLFEDISPNESLKRSGGFFSLFKKVR